MLVVGAKGMAKEILELLSVERRMSDSSIVFFDNVNLDTPDLLFNRFKVIRSFDAVSRYFENVSKDFILGVGNPLIRRTLAEKFTQLGGKLQTVISKSASIGSFNTKIGEGSIIMQGARITNDVTIGKGVLININATISHDSKIGDFTEIASGVNISGRCIIEDEVFLGANCVINPDIKIGDRAIIGSGAVVISDVLSNTTMVGNPAKLLKHNG